MERTRYRLRLELNDPAAAVTIHAKRCDSGRSILATLLSGGAVYPVSDDLSAVFTARKPDGKVLYNACTIEAGRIRYDLTPQTTAAAGLMECELRLFRGEQLITSPRFHLMVEDTVYDENAEIESTSEFTTLTGLVGKIEEMLRNGDFKGDPFTYADFTAEQLEDLRSSIYGYYIPSLDDSGNLTFTPTSDTMPQVAGGNITGPAPVKGVDYFTSDDKAEMLAQLSSAALVSGYYVVVGSTTLEYILNLNWNATAVTGIRHFHLNNTTGEGIGLTGICHGTVYRATDTHGEVILRTIYGGQSYTIHAQREDGVWQPWEWEQPPMQPGVEYRTTERWEGKPVYRKRIGCGAMPNASSKRITVQPFTTAYTLLDCHVVMRHTGNASAMLLRYGGDPATFCEIQSTHMCIALVTSNDFSNYNAEAVIRYVKD